MLSLCACRGVCCDLLYDGRMWFNRCAVCSTLTHKGPQVVYTLLYTKATSYSVHVVQYFILVNSRIVRKGALFRVLQDPNSAPSRTIQARNHIVRVPTLVRVFWLGTYPHYSGTPTVYWPCHIIIMYSYSSRYWSRGEKKQNKPPTIHMIEQYSGNYSNKFIK